MNFFESISIKNRMVIMLFAWLLIFVVFGIFVYNKMEELSEVSKNLNDHSIRKSTAAIDARVNIIKIQSETKDLMLLKDAEKVRDRLNHLVAIDEKVLNSLGVLENRCVTLQDRKLVSDIKNLFRAWRSSRQRVINMVQTQDEDEALNIYESNTEYVRQLEEKLDDVVKDEQAVADQFINRVNEIQLEQRRDLIISISAFSMVSLLLLALAVRSILKPISLFQEAMYTSVNTGELIEVNLSGNNEIVEMSKYYNKLITKLKEVFWLKDGRNSVSEALSGDISLSEFTSKAISTLSKIMDAGHGVFYLYNSDKAFLYLNSSYAFTERDTLSNKFALGEGIVGQVALERKAILLKHIKRQDSLITTGVFNEAPLNTYTLPLIYENELYGVIELSSFEPFTHLKQEFLNDAAGLIAAELYSVIQSQRVKELLQVSEEAQKEAKNKAFELEAVNKILEEQQRVLQHQTEELQHSNAQMEEQQQLMQQQSEELQQSNAQLEEQQQLLEEQSRQLNSKNEELEISKEELTRRTIELERVNKYKSEFLANMSHELRTPLNSIILLSNMLKRKNTNEFCEKDAEKVEIIYKAGQELLRLINDILDLSKIESGKMGLNISNFDSRELSSDLAQMFKGIANENSIDFIVYNNLNTKLRGDKDKISQILRNFLSNAFKFTEQGSVTLNMSRDKNSNDGVIFSVIDTGIGISEEKIINIFEEFQQVNNGSLKKYGGTGLGLSISKKLAELMGGEIRARSEEGAGSNFSLYVPGILQKEMIESTSINIKNGNGCLGEKSKVILIIESDRNYAQYIERVCRYMGFDTLVAYEGREGLELIKQYKIEGILLDMQLLDISGAEVLRELKSTLELRNVPVHIIYASDTKQKNMVISEELDNSTGNVDVMELFSKIDTLSEKGTKNLLIVEDDGFLKDMLRKFTENKDKDIRTKTVDTEEKAKFELAKEVYDAAIVDLTLKEGNGIDVCRFIKDQDIEIPAIVYTGKNMSKDEEKEIRRYADSIIIKTPGSEKRFIDEVNMFLHRVKRDQNRGSYLFSKVKKECALSLEKKKILIVDDDPRNLFVIATALEDYGAQIIDADSGKGALDILTDQKVDLVLMDIMMPVMDGFEAIRAIRSNDKTKDIPIIALTAKSLKGDREKCIEAGANDYISKPVDYDTLIRLIKAWIDK